MYEVIYLVYFTNYTQNKYYVQTQIALATQKPNLRDPNTTRQSPLVACLVFPILSANCDSTSFFQK